MCKSALQFVCLSIVSHDVRRVSSSHTWCKGIRSFIENVLDFTRLQPPLEVTGVLEKTENSFSKSEDFLKNDFYMFLGANIMDSSRMIDVRFF